MITYDNYLDNSTDIDNWIRLICVDPTDPKARYKREQIANLINLTHNQKTIVDMYIMEENTGKRHWELDPEDKNIYMEWMHGTNILRNKVNLFKTLSKHQQQKAMYNSGEMSQQSQNGNSPEASSSAAVVNPFIRQQSQQQQPIPPGDRIIRTSSGKEYKASERPDLARLANKPKKGYPRKSRSR